ncbi:unnamed protein product, partial [Rotaria magnacalcarata]
ESLSLSEVLGDTRYDYIVCLSFRFVEENDAQLSDMYNYRYDKSNFNSSNSHRKRKKWHEDRRIIANIRKNVQQFIEFAKANVDNEKLKFIVDEEYLVDHIKNAELILYDDGAEKKALSYQVNQVRRWADAARGTEKVRKYKVMYRKVGENENETEEKWTEVYTNSNQKELIISNLPSETTFVFKVQSITAIGLSLISDISEPMETLTKKEPRTPLALKQTSSDVDVLHTKNAQITFEIDGLPRPNITWLFNGNPIQPSAKYQMEARYQIILNVNKTDFVDSGTYTAVIEYGIEKLKVPVKMTVKGNIKSLSLLIIHKYKETVICPQKKF